MQKLSNLHKARIEYQPKLPSIFINGPSVKIIEGKAAGSVADQNKIQALFPKTYGMPNISFEPAEKQNYKPLNLGGSGWA